MAQAAVVIEPVQAVAQRRQAQPHERNERGRSEHAAEDRHRRAAKRRQPQEYAEPGQRQEHADRGQQPGQRRPQPFPENRPARPLERRRKQRARRFGARRLGGWVGRLVSVNQVLRAAIAPTT